MTRLDERLAPAGWWWVFVLLIAAPAAALAMLGASTWRADEIERQHMLQQQKARTTTLMAIAVTDVAARALEQAAITFEVGRHHAIADGHHLQCRLHDEEQLDQ